MVKRQVASLKLVAAILACVSVSKEDVLLRECRFLRTKEDELHLYNIHLESNTRNTHIGGLGYILIQSNHTW